MNSLLLIYVLLQQNTPVLSISNAPTHPFFFFSEKINSLAERKNSKKYLIKHEPKKNRPNEKNKQSGEREGSK